MAAALHAPSREAHRPRERKLDRRYLGGGARPDVPAVDDAEGSFVPRRCVGAAARKDC